ncbi:class III extradiol ring-cleavage dioxygenase [Aquitalea sp. ASV15]|uniref:DODA-type extradiol aromatic ring-opening family dioxygenase n=1 Tax=Aquitalea sp. ASV15 TaxID=2795104 RepID=UPI0018EA9C04|nr:class III extradiol ring-cleavage dioxygenase [Aquitalea sp. ASV15]
MTTRQPALFISHGAPTLPIEHSATRDFLQQLGQQLPRPRAIVVLSAHWESTLPMVNLAEKPGTLYDFGGFPPILYTLRYPASTDLTLAAEATDLLRQSGFRVGSTDQRGLDHGMWTPLMLMYPQADIPLVMVSLPHAATADTYYRMGRALRALRDDNVMIVGSGSYTHNLWQLGRDGSAPPSWAEDFAQWMDHALSDNRPQDILNWKQLAPHARENHPSDEHFNPLLVAMGAASDDTPPHKLHDDWRMGSLSMACWRFD